MSIRINRVYTKTGDDGGTHLVGGHRVSKDDVRIECYGTVDELNATIGLDSSKIVVTSRWPGAYYDAWTAAYTLLSDVMLLGAMEEEAAISG